ncbi:hypothetical protein KP509_13G060900 [Ceratopteris richardii]|uniref:Ribosomal protein L15 n=1 Tax=Ceratopteris richardii TaxID=49495 RepID=A0A8T2TG31_CERRI|nr:hypothetical protein KP509_13G060900 [Ceratopteris richardii]
MGIHKYVELWQKKQFDIQFLGIVSHSPTSKQGYVVMHTCLRESQEACFQGYSAWEAKILRSYTSEVAKDLWSVAEERAGRKLGGMGVSNSYWINRVSSSKHLEVILVDPAHTAIHNTSPGPRPSIHATWKSSQTLSLRH